MTTEAAKAEETTVQLPKDAVLLSEVLKTPPVLENNGVKLQSKFDTFTRGFYEGQEYLTIEITEQNYQDYVKFRGLEKIIQVLQQVENRNNQNCLCLGAASVIGHTLPDGKEIKYFTAINLEKLIDSVTKSTYSGETISDLRKSIEEFNGKVQKLSMEFSKMFAVGQQSTPQAMDLMKEVARLGQRIHVCEEQIALKRAKRENAAEKEQE